MVVPRLRGCGNAQEKVHGGGNNALDSNDEAANDGVRPQVMDAEDGQGQELESKLVVEVGQRVSNR